MKHALLFTLLVGYLLSACSVLPAGVLLPNAAGESPTHSAPTSQPEEIVLEYSRSGGFAGRTDTWQIDAQGKITGSTGQTGTIAASDLGRLVASFAGLDFSAAPGDSATCNDCYTYRVIVRSGDVEKLLTAFDGQPSAPKGFWRALETLQNALPKS